jgi:hypothetical protein
VYESERNVMALALTNSADPIRIVATPAFEKSGRVSPDGRWIAYQSDDTGDFQIYVQPFPGPGTAMRVSTTLGNHPQWRGDGREVFWMGPDPKGVPATVFSAALTFDGDSLRAAAARVVLPLHVRISPLIDSRSHYVVAPDGQRFLLRQVDGLPGPAVKMILNWPELLKTR